ncbi:hypothetical protein P153DRAFT_392636 [Dothidotthia symphoricarpi CBS 119687]|uniref:MYND-type domain-containing protein n=1 Tax=Dothidotthia symphoricarpi CBS 119687 TaxID=1392245 RepID=A0A6A6AST1_9PLEO|nr:uncharacterized protein P153DRAFT_392636 [Dothidotthia symphoricarpi CBS 119687]KAF2134014.1 hypothetical protein P153DRAFT_392636 [Dothidotthia symphoricarpi CBS 119687]
MASDPHAACSFCGKPAQMKCNGCKTHMYCQKECQVRDWPNHKVICKAQRLEQAIERMANITHQAYLTFRENTWDTPIEKIEDKEDELVIFDGDQKLNLRNFTPFPDKLVKNDRTKMAMLCMLICNEPLAFMHSLITKLLRGVDVTVEELQVQLRTVPRKAIFVAPDGSRQSNWPEFSHMVLRLKSVKSGKQWVVDLSGGQYGICQPFWDWEIYVANYVGKITAIYSSGTQRELITELAKIDGNPVLTYRLVQDAADQLNKAVDIWEERHMKLSRLLFLGDAAYRQQEMSLLDIMKAAVRSFINSTDFAKPVQAARAYEQANPGFSQRKCCDRAMLLQSVNLLNEH